MLLWVSVKLLILPWLEPRTIISPKAILLKQSSLLIHLSAYILFSFSVVVVVIFFPTLPLFLSDLLMHKFLANDCKNIAHKPEFFFLFLSFSGQ